jgi:hypothetical protein
MQLNTQEELDKFKNYVIQQSKSNLTKLKKNSSKKLYDSIKGKVKVMPNSFSMEFTMEDYGQYQDKGVNGKRTAYATPFSYRDKMPPPKAFDKWIVKKGIAPRDKNGKFLSRQSLQFALSRKIFMYGIKPTLFFTKPFEKAYEKLPSQLIDKYGLDALELFNHTIKQPKKK